MANFTTEEKELFNAQSLPERPSFFSRVAQREQQISQDFERFLILQTQVQKQTALNWINKAQEIEVDNEDRDEILSTYLGIRQTDAADRVTELDEKLEDFNSFMNGFFSDEASTDCPDRFANVPELSLFVQSLQRPLSKMTIQRDQAFHEGNLVLWLRERLTEEQTNQNSQQELESWKNVIAAYRGRPG